MSKSVAKPRISLFSKQLRTVDDVLAPTNTWRIEDANLQIRREYESIDMYRQCNERLKSLIK